MATLGDTLLIKLGIDTSDLKASLNQVRGQIRNSSNQMMQDDNRQTANHSRNATQTKNDLKGVSNGFTGALSSALKFGTGASAASSQVMGSVMGLVKSVSGPLMGLFTATAITKSYFGGLGQLAEMTGSYYKKLDEWREKMALFRRFTKEDINLYAKGRRALTDFRIAMADFSAGLMREFNPLMKKGVDLLNAVSKWVNAHQQDIIRFCKVLAGIITTMLIPAFAKLAMTILLNPLTWIIGLVVLLALAIDDLIVYLQGGESLLGHYWDPLIDGAKEAWAWIKDLWDQFSRTEVFDDLKTTFGDFLDVALSSLANMFAAIKTVWGLLSDLCSWLDSVGFFDSLLEALAYLGDLSQRVVNFIISAFGLLFAVFSGDTDRMRDAWDKFIHSIGRLVSWFGGLFKGVFDEIVGLVKKIGGAFESLGQKIAKALNIDGLIAGCKKAIADLIDYIPDFLKPDSLKDWASEVKNQTDNNTESEVKTAPVQIEQSREQTLADFNALNDRQKARLDEIKRLRDTGRVDEALSLADKTKSVNAQERSEFYAEHPEFLKEVEKYQRMQNVQDSLKNASQQINALSQGAGAIPNAQRTTQTANAPISAQNNTNNNNSRTITNNVTINGADADMTRSAMDSLNDNGGNTVSAGIQAQSYA